MIKFYEALSAVCATFIMPVANLAARIYVGMDFFRSGMLKLEDMEEAIEEFAVDGSFETFTQTFSFLSPTVSAYLTTSAELVLPVLLMVGLFTRVSAIGLFIMALVIELVVLPGASVQHFYWMIIFAMLIGQGGHKISLDNLLLKIKQ